LCGTLFPDKMSEQDPTSEPLPDSPRVVYARNPLIEVLCQVRFPSILKIGVEAPAAFQERIRGEYPILIEKPMGLVEMGMGVPPAISQALRNILPNGRDIVYEFASADERWKVTLTKDFLALSTSAYQRWEEFRAHLKSPMEALIAVYSPSFFIRVGLRYQDLIRRSALNITGADWSNLIKPQMAGALGVSEVAQAIETSFSQVLIRFPHFNAKVRVNFGIVRTPEVDEDCFLIDSDFNTEERTEIADVDQILSYFNRQSGRLFRWCIEDRLHEAMEPAPVGTAT